MLVINQRLAVIGFACLKQLRKSRVRRCQRLRGEHLAQQQCSFTQLVLLHQHQHIDRLRFAGTPRPGLLVVRQEQHAMRH